ncbi:MAG: hypothetical protein V7K33_34610 [Nostoc sp.]
MDFGFWIDPVSLGCGASRILDNGIIPPTQCRGMNRNNSKIQNLKSAQSKRELQSLEKLTRPYLTALSEKLLSVLELSDGVIA